MARKLPRRWSQRNALTIGAAVGLAMLVWNVFMKADTANRTTSNFVGYAIGSVIGGAIMFWVVAAIRNRMVFGRRTN